MVIYRKKFSTLCYISRPNGIPTKYPEIADTIFGRNRPVARFQNLGKYFCLYHMIRTILLSTTQFEGKIKIWGMTAPEFPRVCGPGQNRLQ